MIGLRRIAGIVAGAIARRCSPDLRRRMHTKPGRPTSNLRKPRPASSACSGVRRCSRACACRSRSSCRTACAISRSPASRSLPIHSSSAAGSTPGLTGSRESASSSPGFNYHHRCARALRTTRRHALDRAHPPIAPVDRIRGASRRARHCGRVPRPWYRAHPVRIRPSAVRARAVRRSCARRGCC